MTRPCLLLTVLLLALATGAGAVPLTPSLELSVFDGKAKLAPATGVDCTARPVQQGAVTVWVVNLADTSGQERWLELQLTAASKLAAPGYFPGLKPLTLSGAYETPGWQQALPLAALWDAKGGVAFGLEPHEIVSYVQHTAAAAATGSRATVHLRLALNANQKRELRFFSVPLAGKWGHAEALHHFYRLAPDIYDRDPRVDPRLYTTSAMYAAWQPQSFWSEQCRRNFAGWDWCYAPFKRSGDIVGRPELWDYTPARPFGKGMPLDDRDKFHQWRQERFARGERGDIAMLFYVPAQVWCEERLAKERYPDALTEDPLTKNYWNTPWVTGHDNDIRVFPWWTSFGQQSMKDVADVARELDLSGFAFDTCEGTARYFGKLAQAATERAWDPERGEFVREAVGTMYLREYVHTLRNSRGHRVGVIGNVDLPFYLIARSLDGGLRECPPWEPERGTGDNQRYMLGRKPIVWWNGLGLAGLIDYEHMTPDQIGEAHVGITDFVTLESFRVAYWPTVDFTRGVASAVADLPRLKECLDAGWEPVPAAAAPGAGFVTRYGQGLSTRLAFGNETLQPLRATVTVDSQWLGLPLRPAPNGHVAGARPIPASGAFVFATDDGKPTTNVLSGLTTRVEGVTVAPRKVGVLRACAALSPAPKGVTVVAQWQDTLGGRVLTVKVGKGLKAKTWLRVPGMPDTFCSGEADGKPVPSAMPVGAERVDTQLLPGKATMQVFRFGSLCYPARASDLLDFPFVSHDGKQCASLVIPAGANPDVQAAAERIAEYFRFYYAGALDTPVEAKLPIVNGAPPATGPAVVLDGTGSLLKAKGYRPRFRVYRQGDRLTVSAATPQALRQGVLDMLRELDHKYAYPGTLPWRYHTHSAKIVGKYVGLDGRIHGSTVPPE